MTLEGIDVSRYQRTTPNLAGLSFLMARATYGTARDPMFATHIANARKAGLLVGAYHFGVGDISAPVQGGAFLAAAGAVDFYVLDLERNGSAMSMTHAQATLFMAGVRAKGHRIGLYHSDSGFPSLGQDWSWVAKWGATPPSRSWAFWQYRGSPLDLDRFHGDSAALHALAGQPVRQPTPWRVAISGRTPLYSRPNGTRLRPDVVKATYICTRAKVEGLWWYRIRSTASGAPTTNAGKWFKPNRHTEASRA